MIIFLNGSFGVGKTTVARHLRRSLPGSLIYDPEWIGSIIIRLPRFLRPKGSGTGDYQDIPFWRRATVKGIRLFSLLTGGRVIVPMTFTNRDYLDEITSGVKDSGLATSLFCLKAPLQVVKERLARRGDPVDDPRSAWVARRIIECAQVLDDSYFGEPIDTEGRSAAEVAEFVATSVMR